MVDIATVSVVSSAGLAALTIAANVFTGERQRKHESDLDFERRVWDKKSEALFVVIETCEELIEAPDPEGESDQWLAFGLSRLLDALTANRAAVDAFASSTCRNELTSLIKAMNGGGVKEGLGRRWDRLWDRLREVDIRTDYERWKSVWEQREKAESEVLDGFAPDMQVLRGQAERLLEAARESVRRPKD
ncbi:hypothetical protein GCM10023350_48760 [Nocardioides endophyticus]|uniref:SLATT domain-containing protein n=1 Tax=Nocardioides endophyticus TaxID=1353775 RepID=A0ABP8ZIG9_9ACTN